MKTRNGFVSNSSSSSFILGTKDKNPKLTIEVYLKELSTYTLFTKEDVLNYFYKVYYLEDFSEIEEDEYLFDEYTTIIEAINDGNTIYVCSVSSDEGGIASFLYDSYIDSFIDKETMLLIKDVG